MTVTTRRRHSRRAPFTLDDRDLRVIGMLIAGAPMKEIAGAIGTSKVNATMVMARMRERFGAQNNEQLVALLFRRGIVS